MPIEKSPIVIFNSEEASNFSISEESGLPFYIAANLTKDKANQTFVLGDRHIYNGFYNAPLVEEREYEVLVGVVSSFNGVNNFLLEKCFEICLSPMQKNFKHFKACCV